MLVPRSVCVAQVWLCKILGKSASDIQKTHSQMLQRGAAEMALASGKRVELNSAHDLLSRSKTMDDNAASFFRILTPMKSRCVLPRFAFNIFKLHFRTMTSIFFEIEVPSVLGMTLPSPAR